MRPKISIAAQVRNRLSDKDWRMSNLYRIVNKQGRDVKFTLNWAQIEMLQGIHTRVVTLKARQLGSTTFWCIYLLDEALWNPNRSFGIISYSLSSAHDILNKTLKHAVKTLKPKIAGLPQLQIEKDSAREIGFANGSSVKVDTTMRGGTLSGLLCTEFGKIKK